MKRLVTGIVVMAFAGLAGMARADDKANLTGTWITAEQATDPGYWVRQLREPVRFSEGLQTLIEKPQRVLLEVGPAHTLVALAKRRFPAGSAGLALASLRHPRQAEPDETFSLNLSSPTGYTVLSDATGIATIANDD